MKIYVSVKQAGKRKDFLSKKEMVLQGAPASLRGLITEVINLNVAQYNEKPLEQTLIKFLTFEEIEAQAQIGKVGFGERFNPQQADAAQAVETAIIAFTDGLFRVFIGDQEATSLDEPLEIKEGDILTFIRFTMLAGRMW